MWSSWDESTSGGCFNFPTFASNPQFPVTVNHSSPVTLGVYVHQLGQCHAIGASVIDSKGFPLTFKPAESDVLGSSSKYVREPTISFQVTLPPRKEPYMLMATTFTPGQNGDFQVSIGPPRPSSEPSSWVPTPEEQEAFLAAHATTIGLPHETEAVMGELYPHRVSIRDVWAGRSAGGCVNYPSVKDNPQFLLTVTEPDTRVCVSLTQRPDGESAASPPDVVPDVPIAFYICDKHGKKLQTLLSSDVVVSSGQYATQRQIRLITTLQPRTTPYTCMATTFEPGMEAEFEWTYASSHPIVFEKYHRVAPTASSYGMKYLASLASEWAGPTAGGSVNEATVGNNPQFYLYVPSPDTSVIIELEQTGGSSHPIAVYCADKGGMLASNMAKAEIVASSGKYVKETAVSVKTTLSPLLLPESSRSSVLESLLSITGSSSAGTTLASPADAPDLLPYTVLPSTFSPGQEGPFTVQVYSDKPLRLEPAFRDSLFLRRGLAYKATVSSAWVPGSTAGGCANFDSAASNPQFQLVVLPDGVSPRGRISMVLEQEYHDSPEAPNGKDLHIIGGYVVDNQGKRVEYLYEESIITSTPRYVQTSSVETMEALARPSRPYTVFPSTFYPDKPGTFSVTVYSDMEISLTPLPFDVDPLETAPPLVELHSIWKGDSAGGAINFPSAINNPQFSLFVPPGPDSPPDSPVNVRLTLFRQAPEMSVEIPIGFIVADVGGSRVSSELGSRALVGDSGPFISVQQVSVTMSLLPSNTPYTVMPSTFEPGVNAVFTLSARSSLPSVRMTKWRQEHDVEALKLQSLSHVVSVSSAWEGLTAGGCINFPTSALNPMYGLSVSGTEEDVHIHILLRQKAPPGKELVPIGILIAELNGADPRVSPIKEDQAIATSGDFLNAAEVTTSTTLAPSEHPYLVFVSTFAPNQEAEFDVVVTSDAPVTLTELGMDESVSSPQDGNIPLRKNKPPLKPPPLSGSGSRLAPSSASSSSDSARLAPPSLRFGGNPPRAKTVVVRLKSGEQEKEVERAKAALEDGSGQATVDAEATDTALAKAKADNLTRMFVNEDVEAESRILAALEQAKGDLSPRSAVEAQLGVLDALIDLADDFASSSLVDLSPDSSRKSSAASRPSSTSDLPTTPTTPSSPSSPGGSIASDSGDGSGNGSGGGGGGGSPNARERRMSNVSPASARMSIVPRSVARSSTLHADLMRIQSSSSPPPSASLDGGSTSPRRGSLPDLHRIRAPSADDEPLGAKGSLEDFPVVPVPVPVIRQLLEFLFSLFDSATPSHIFGTVLMQPDGMLVRAMAKTLTIKQSERIAMPLVHVFGSRSRLMILVQTLIEFEIDRTAESAGSTLFRSNTLTTKVMSAYCTVMGSDFLTAVIEPVLQKVEKDPSKMKIEKYGDNPEENIETLLGVLNSLVDSIFSSSSLMPAEIRTICHALVQRARSKFPRNEIHVLAGLVFLRFICPALVTPSKYGLRSEPLSRPVQQGLVMVSKTIQRLANGVSFPGKEPYMLRLNTFIEERSQQLNAYLMELAAVDVGLQTIKHGTAVAHFEAVEVDELSFVQGQRIYDLVTTDSPEWMCGCVNGKTGLFPAEFAIIRSEHVPKYDVEPICELTIPQRNALIDVIREVLSEAQEPIVDCLSADYRAGDDDVNVFRMEKDTRVKSTFRSRLLAKFRRQ